LLVNAPGLVVVMRETPSLASALTDFLDGEGIPAILRPIAPLEGILRGGAVPAGASILISTCSAFRCEIVEQWQAGAFPDTELIVIGSRDPAVRTGNGLYRIDLPLSPSELLALVRERLERRTMRAEAPPLPLERA
jgi:hypothetical protein